MQHSVYWVCSMLNERSETEFLFKKNTGHFKLIKINILVQECQDSRTGTCKNSSVKRYVHR